MWQSAVARLLILDRSCVSKCSNTHDQDHNDGFLVIFARLDKMLFYLWFFSFKFIDSIHKRDILLKKYFFFFDHQNSSQVDYLFIRTCAYQILKSNFFLSTIINSLHFDLHIKWILINVKGKKKRKRRNYS